MQISLYDFNKNWDHVKQHLEDPSVMDTLDTDMYEYSRLYKPKELPVFDLINGIGPWQYSYSNYWDHKIDAQMMDSPESNLYWDRFQQICEFHGLDTDQVCEDPQTYLEKQLVWEFETLHRSFFPKEGTLGWYQCFGSGHYLMHWQKLLAGMVLPSYCWGIFMDYSGRSSEEYGAFSTVVGINGEGEFMVFDILHFESMTAIEIMQRVGLQQTEDVVREIAG